MLKPISIIACLVCFFQSSTAQTNISGQIRTNTTWTKSGSPYIISGTLEVAPAVSLIIEPGVVVQVEKDIDVYGHISALGTSTDSILFIKYGAGSEKRGVGVRSSVSRETYEFKYCRFEYVSLGVGGDNRLNVENCKFNRGSVSGSDRADMFIANNKIMYGDSWLWDTDTCTFINNTMEYGYFWVNNARSTTYIGNNVSRSKYGIECNSVNVTIKDNIVHHTNEIGIYLKHKYMDSTNPVTGNIVFDNDGTGIYVWQCWGTLSGNSVYNNKVGIQYNNQPVAPNDDIKIVNNCIYDNDYNFYNTVSTDYHIGPNWWGTTDSSAIDSTVFDYYDDFKIGYVTFMPVLGQADSSCRYIPPSNIPEITATQAISVYPNPFGSSLVFDMADTGMLLEVALYNVQGTKIISTTNMNGGSVILETGQLPQGLYIYKALFKDNSVQTGKVIHR